jgi:hypothetical protein
MSARVTGAQVGHLLQDFRTLPHAISVYVAEKVDDVDDVVREWPVLQIVVVFLAAAVMIISFLRLCRTCTT